MIPIEALILETFTDYILMFDLFKSGFDLLFCPAFRPSSFDWFTLSI